MTGCFGTIFRPPAGGRGLQPADVGSDLGSEGLELGDLRIEHRSRHDGGVERTGDLIEVDPDPPQLLLHGEQPKLLATAELRSPMQAPAEHRQRPLRPQQPVSLGGRVKGGLVLVLEPQSQLGRLPANGCGPGWRSLTDVLGDKGAEPFGAAAGGDRVELCGQRIGKLEGEHGHERSVIYKYAGAKPILPSHPSRFPLSLRTLA